MAEHSRRATTSGSAPWLLPLLACPHCGAELAAVERSLRCRSCGQSYTSEPYLDLLAPGKRPPNEGPGDSAEMARRRLAWERRVLAAGSGERRALNRYLDIVLPYLQPGAVVLDLGCGTGSVLSALSRRVAAPLTLIGLDISRPMLDAAGRALRHEPRAAVLRASSRRRLPIRDGSVDAVLRRLAPALADEALRVLKPGGAFVTASYGPEHWRELHDLLPELPRPRATRPSATRPKANRAPATDLLLAQGFAAAEHHDWRGTERLAPAEAVERLLLGPAGFHVDRARDLRRLRERAESEAGAAGLLLTTDTQVTVGVKGEA